LLNKSSFFAPALSVNKLTNFGEMILVTLCCATYIQLRCSTNPPLLGAATIEQFVEQNLILCCSFKFEQINKFRRNDFGHTLLCYSFKPYLHFVENLTKLVHFKEQKNILH
jgi:hypothetical protein